MRRGILDSQADTADRSEFGNSTATSQRCRRRRFAVVQKLFGSNGTNASNHGDPSTTPWTYGRPTAMREPRDRPSHKALIAGVAITTSPIQFGKKTAIRIE